MAHQIRHGLQFWHGSQDWRGAGPVKPVHRGAGRKLECGPGLYLTTRLMTANKYAKGGGQLVLITIDAKTRWLEDVDVPVEQTLEFVQGQSAMRHKREVIADLHRYAERHPNGIIPANYLVNLMVDHESLGGARGPALADWLIEHRIDASNAKQSGQESWCVVFNPKVVLDASPMRSAQIDWANADFPTIEVQLTQVRAAAVSPSMGM